MTIRVPTWVAATLLCLAPATALPLDWRASAGLGYQRADTWAPEAPRVSQPHLDISLALQLRGDIVAPTLFSYYGSVGWTRTTSSINGADTVTYDAAVLSQAVGKPVRVQLSRKDEMAWENYGNLFAIDQRVGLDKDGNKAEVYFDTKTLAVVK